MKQTIKLINARLDKFFFYSVIAFVVQFLVIAICVALNISETKQILGASSMIMAFNSITDFDYVFSTLITVATIIYVSVLAVKVGDIKYYMSQGVKASKNMFVNFSIGTILSILVALVYYAGTMLGRLLALIIKHDYFTFDNLTSYAISSNLWQNVAAVFLATLTAFLLFSCIYKMFIWHKTVAIGLVSTVVLGVLLVALIGLPRMSEQTLLKLFSPSAGYIALSIVAIISAGVYSIIEFKGDMSR